MKKLLIIVCMITLGASSVFAQDSGVGIRGGLNFSTFGRDNVDNTSRMKVGYHAGLYMKLGVTETLAFQPEVLYSTKGATTTSVNGPLFQHPENNEFYKERTTSLHYIDVPVFLRLNFGSFHILGGPQVSFLMSQRHMFSEGSIADDNFRGDHNVRNTDYAAVAGIGFESKHGFNIGIRGAYGLVPVFEDQPDDRRTNRNMVGQITVGYTLGSRYKY